MISTRGFNIFLKSSKFSSLISSLVYLTYRYLFLFSIRSRFIQLNRKSMHKIFILCTQRDKTLQTIKNNSNNAFSLTSVKLKKARIHASNIPDTFTIHSALSEFYIAPITLPMYESFS